MTLESEGHTEDHPYGHDLDDSLGQTSSLDIPHSTMEDAGTYVCRGSHLAIASTKVHVLNSGNSLRPFTLGIIL